MSYTDEQVAMIIHATVSEMQRLANDTTPSPPWHYQDIEVRKECVATVRRIRDEGRTAQEVHEDWLAFKRDMEWTFGRYKDPELRTHPCIVQWEDLPGYQQDKSILIVAIVEALT